MWLWERLGEMWDRVAIFGIGAGVGLGSGEVAAEFADGSLLSGIGQIVGIGCLLWVAYLNGSVREMRSDYSKDRVTYQNTHEVVAQIAADAHEAREAAERIERWQLEHRT